MGSFVPNTARERAVMLRALGAESPEALFDSVPPAARAQPLNLPAGRSELEVRRLMEALASENHVFRTVFRGAGAERHYIPAAVRRIAQNETLLTAYTPYQAEISQGALQAIFEYQTMMCELTGMAAANASVYDGASAAAEAAAMCAGPGRTAVFAPPNMNPHTLQTLRTYCAGYGIAVEYAPVSGGAVDAEALAALLAREGGAAAVLVQQPNFFGIIEDLAACADAAHGAGARLVAVCNPLALGILKSPGECGADIACGEGQPLGLPLAFGGPYLGFMACTAPLLRRLPGRIAGETTDAAGRRAFVLTLQAREQHIRREKASSNICSNEAHCALQAAVYLSVMGPDGLAEAARQCRAKAAYAAERFSAVPGFGLVYPDAPFFHEFVTYCPDAERTLAALAERDMLGGLPLAGGRMLWCVTELNTKDEIDAAAAALKEAV